jgi:DNA polymerase-1
VSLRAWDCETTTRSAFKRKATPFGGLNHVVAHAWQSAGKPVAHAFGGKARLASGWLLPVLKDCKLLAGFNIKFDLLHALQDEQNLDAWMTWVAEGGQVWDCQLAEYLLEGMVQQSHMLSLDEVAPRYGGQLKFDEVKALWEAGVQTDDIEPKLLLRYLCGEGDELGDVGNTLKIAQAQIARARDSGQLRSILLNMGALLCTIEIERNGMYVDKPRGLELAKELAALIAEAQASMVQYLPDDLPFEFKWTSPKHKSALIFGGSIKYPKREYMLAADYGCAAAGEYIFEEEFQTAEDFREFTAYVQKEETHFVLKDGTTTPLPGGEDGAAPVDLYVFYGSGKNKGEPKTKKVKVPDRTKPKSRIGEDTFFFPGYTKPEKAWAWESDPGVYTTDAETIELLANRGIPFLVQLAKLQKMTKDLGTYFITVDEDGNEKGMLSLVDAAGIIHHKINATSTVTGRFSSSDPNLQNIPKGNKSQVKTLFVSRFGADGKIIQSDFKSLEIYIQAILTDCKQLIADLKAGLDLHCKRLAAKTGKTYDEVVALCKSSKEWDYQRTGAKVFSFQRAYGAGAQKIADSTGMPLEDVQALIEAEGLIFPEIDAYFEARTEEIKANRKPAGIVVPHPSVRGVTCALGKSFATTPDGKVYSYMESPSPEYLVKRGIMASFSPTEIKNYEVQGEGGEWAKAALWLAIREFYRQRNFGGLGLLVNQVHDATYADAHKDVALEVAATLHACMEGASDLMEWYFDWQLQLPVPSDTTWGASMMDDDSIPGVKERAAVIRKELRDRYMDGYAPSFI